MAIFGGCATIAFSELYEPYVIRRVRTSELPGHTHTSRSISHIMTIFTLQFLQTCDKRWYSDISAYRHHTNFVLIS